LSPSPECDITDDTLLTGLQTSLPEILMRDVMIYTRQVRTQTKTKKKKKKKKKKN
jgi:hypothetical protein